MSFTLTYNATTAAYTATDADDVATDGGSRFFVSASGGKYFLTQKDNSGNIVGTSVNLGANGASNLTIYLGDGRDYYVTDSTVTTTTPNGSDVKISVFGGTGNDTITGGVEKNTFRGETGDDNIDGGVGNDTIHGDAGNDTLFGGSNSDYVYGDDGADDIYGGGGNDRLYGGLGSDELFSGSGADYMYDNSATSTDGVYDLFHANAASGSLISGDGSDGLVIDQPT